jgi:periplasmic protein CpxP/Spy
MKQLFLSAALAGAMIAAGLPATAQTATNSQGDNTATQETKEHRHHGKHRMERMAKKLNLTQDQQAKLKPIFEKQREQAKAIKSDTSLTEEQKKEKFQSLRQDSKAQINGILTPEQQQQWEQMRAKHQHGNNGDNQGSAPQGQ